MPLTRYQIRNEYSLADPELYKAADKDDPEELLEGVALAGLVGVLRQLGDLAEFAAEIFHDMHEEVMATAARGHGLMARVQQLEAEVPSIEKAFLSQTNHTPFYSNGGVDWHPNLCTEQNLISHGDLPRCVLDSYEECRGPPRLFLLDKFDVAGAGACLKRYTDPSFFKVDTAPSEPSVVHRERKFRKVKKKGSRLKNGETPEIVPTSHAKLHQLFWEENVEKGCSDPARLVKLKKRQLNALPFESSAGKSYMEKFLETPIEHNEVWEISVAPLPLKQTSDNYSESGLEICDITTVSPVIATSQGKEITCSSHNAHEVALTPSMGELDGDVVDRRIVKVPEPTADGEREEVPFTCHKVMDEKEIAVDGEGKPEGSVNGDNSDDLTSEVDNYMDALTTMESEMETDHEYRLKYDIGFLSVEKQVTDAERNGEQLEFKAHSSDSRSIENFSASDDGNRAFKKGRSRFSYSDTLRNLAEIAPFDGEGSAKVFPNSEAFILDPEKPSNQLPADVAVLRIKSHDQMFPNDMCISEDNICGLEEVSSNSSLMDSNHPMHLLGPPSSSLEYQSDQTPSESMKLGFALSYSDERESNLVDCSTSGMPSQTSDGTPFVVSSESHSVEKLDVRDPHVSSDVSLHLSNNSELAREKKSSNYYPDEVLQMDFAEKGCSDNTVDIKTGSPWSYTSPTGEQVPYLVFTEIEGSGVEKYDDLDSEVVDTLPETEVYRENSTSIGNDSESCSFQEQQLLDLVDNLPVIELESAEEKTLNSEEENIVDSSGTADCEKRGASTCKVDAVDQEAVPLELPSNYTDCSVREDHIGLDDVVVESVQAENMALTFTSTDDVPAEAVADDAVVVCPLEELICFSSNDTENYGAEDKYELECNEMVSPECLTGPEVEVPSKDVNPASCKLISLDECNSQMVDGVQNSLADDITQNGLPAGDVTIPPTASGLSNQELESRSLHQSHLLDGGRDAMSSSAVHLPDSETSSEQPLELQADQLDVECMKSEASSNLENHQSEQIQYLNHTDQSSLSNDVSESCQEDLLSKPSPSGYLQQSTGQEINNTQHEMDSLTSVSPSLGLLPEAAQVHLEEMPPLPPLPPMQWRLGKIQHAPLVPQTEFMDHSLESFPSILPFRDHVKAQSAFPAQQSDALKPASPFLSVSAVELEKSHHVPEQVDNLMQPSLSSLQLPFMFNETNSQTNSHGLDGSRSLNPFLTLSALQDQKPEHGLEGSQSSSNPFSCLPAFEDTASKFCPVSSSEKLIHSLGESASESCLQHTSENLEGEQGNPSGISVLPPRKVEDTAKYDPASSPEKPIHPLNQSASEPGLQYASEYLEGEHGNPSDPSLPPRKVEDTASTYDPVSSVEKPVHPLNQSASEPGLQNAPENSEEEHGHPLNTSVLPPRKVEEQPQHGSMSLEAESAWPSNPFALLATSEDVRVNGSSIVKPPRPRNPLIDAVAALDKSKLRKVTERVRPQSEPKVDERNSLLEEIRTKSFNLKPAVVSRPSIQGPKTNLRVAAILEKANSIRKATAGSDEDDDEDWRDS